MWERTAVSRNASTSTLREKNSTNYTNVVQRFFSFKWQKLLLDSNKFYQDIKIHNKDDIFYS